MCQVTEPMSNLKSQCRSLPVILIASPPPNSSFPLNLRLDFSLGSRSSAPIHPSFKLFYPPLMSFVASKPSWSCVSKCTTQILEIYNSFSLAFTLTASRSASSPFSEQIHPLYSIPPFRPTRVRPELVSRGIQHFKARTKIPPVSSYISNLGTRSYPPLFLGYRCSRRFRKTVFRSRSTPDSCPPRQPHIRSCPVRRDQTRFHSSVTTAGAGHITHGTTNADAFVPGGRYPKGRG